MKFIDSSVCDNFGFIFSLLFVRLSSSSIKKIIMFKKEYFYNTLECVRFENCRYFLLCDLLSFFRVNQIPILTYTAVRRSISSDFITTKILNNKSYVFVSLPGVVQLSCKPRFYARCPGLFDFCVGQISNSLSKNQMIFWF